MRMGRMDLNWSGQVPPFEFDGTGERRDSPIKPAHPQRAKQCGSELADAIWRRTGGICLLLPEAGSSVEKLLVTLNAQT